MWEISQWELNPPYRWVGWSLPKCLKELEYDKILFLFRLSGLAPMAREAKDKHD